MKLLDMYDGYSIVQIHWRELGPIVEALDADGGDEAVATVQTFFEALMYAGRLQVKSGDETLRRFRGEHGLRDWQPDEALYHREPLTADVADDEGRST